MTYTEPPACPGCGWTIPIRRVGSYLVECHKCLRTWDVTEL